MTLLEAPEAVESELEHPTHRRSGGIALLIVLVIVMLLITSVYLFQRRAVLNASITRTGAETFLILVFRSMAETLRHDLKEAMEAVAARG